MRRTWKTALTTLATLAMAGLLLGGGAAMASADSPGAGEPPTDLPPGSASPAVSDGTLPGSPNCKASPGNLVGAYKNGKWATLEIYWDGKRKANCAFLRHGPKVPDGGHMTGVRIWTCKSSKKGEPCGRVSDEAVDDDPPYYDVDVGEDYTTYAGKVSVKGVGKGGKPKCVYAYGYVRAKGKWHSIDINGKTDRDAPARGNHCG
ncbi:MAG: hypothetical protein GEV03_25590 [Streptosporangiales bacterium]|nr:hypothetical protein [Streptosporangiales bacterium]